MVMEQIVKLCMQIDVLTFNSMLFMQHVCLRRFVDLSSLNGNAATDLHNQTLHNFYWQYLNTHCGNIAKNTMEEQAETWSLLDSCDCYVQHGAHLNESVMDMLDKVVACQMPQHPLILLP